MRKLWWAVGFTIAGIVVFGVQSAQACQCETSGPPCEAAFKTPAVFLGRVLSISNGVSSGVRRMSVRLVRVAVTESFRGMSGTETEVTVSTADNEGECGYSFVVGTEYIVYGRPLSPGTYDTNICTRTRAAKDAADDLAYLRGQFRTPRTFGQILGRIERWDPVGNTGGTVNRAPLSNVKILARGNRHEYSTVSRTDGSFDVSVPAGKYEIQPELSGPLHARVFPDVVEVLDVRGCGSVVITVRSDGRGRDRVDASGKVVPVLAVKLSRMPTK